MSWEKVRLLDIIYPPISGEWGDGEGNINVLRTTNFTNDGKLNLSDVVKRDVQQKKVNQKKLIYGDTIIEKSGGGPSQPVGRVVYFDQHDGEYLCNNFTSILRAKDGIDKRYLFWFLFYNHQNKNTLKYQNKTTGIINLKLERYTIELEIPLPPLPIQKQIAAILDAADTLRRKDQELLKKYDELAQAIFIDMFGDPVKNEKGWEVKTIADVTENYDSYRKPVKSSDREKIQGVYPYYGATGVIDYVNEYLLEGEFVLISEDGKNLVGRYKDIAFSATGKIWVNNHAHVLKGIEVNNYFLKYYLNKIDLMPFITGIDQFKLNRSNLDMVPVLVPDSESQKKFETSIKHIEMLKTRAEANITYSDSLFTTLLQQSFKGELVKEEELV